MPNPGVRMISTESRWVLAVLLGLAVAAPVDAATLVVRVVGPVAAKLARGAQLDNQAVLTLAGGDQVTILDSRGTRVFTGPGRFAIAAASAPPPSAYTALLTQKRDRIARIAAVRGAAPGEAQPPGLWAIDTRASATVCALDATRLSLWRADPALTLAIAPENGAAVPLGFRNGAAIAAWPAALPVTDGARFTVTGGAAPAVLTLRLLPPPATLDALGAALLAAGCEAQLDRLARATASASVTPP